MKIATTKTIKNFKGDADAIKLVEEYNRGLMSRRQLGQRLRRQNPHTIMLEKIGRVAKRAFKDRETVDV